MVLKWIFKEAKMRNCVYRFLNKDNKVIYVGKAKDLKSRILNHKHLSEECYKERNKVEYVRFVSEDDMDFAERYYIMKFNPKYNTVLSNKIFNITSSELDEKMWTEYTGEEVIVKELKYNQEVAFELGLYFDDLAILRYFDNFRKSGKMYKREIDGEIYYWIVYEKIVEDYPLFKLRFKNPTRKVAEMMRDGSLNKVLKNKTLHWNGKQKGTFSFYAINHEVYNRLIKE